MSCLQMSFVLPACVWGVGLSHVDAAFIPQLPTLARCPGLHPHGQVYWGLASRLSGVGMQMGRSSTPTTCTVAGDPNHMERPFQLLAEGRWAGTLQRPQGPSQGSPQGLGRGAGHLKPVPWSVKQEDKGKCSVLGSVQGCVKRADPRLTCSRHLMDTESQAAAFSGRTTSTVDEGQVLDCVLCGGA